MKSTRCLLFCALTALMLGAPAPAPAEEAEEAEEAPAQTADDSPTTTTTTTEAGAPAMDAPAPVKRATRGYKQPKPRAIPRNPEGGGGGGGGGGAVPRQRPQDDDPDEGENTWEPEPPQGRPSNMNCDMPPLHHINVHFMGGNGNRLRADSTPIVCSTDPGTRHERYCQETMNDPNRRCCPVKPEGHPMRVACELILLGKDPADGIAGPRWSYIGSDPNGGVEKHPENPFLAFAYGSGKARACSNVVKVCGEGTYKVK